MKYFIILLTLFFNSNIVYSQDSLRYKEVDDFIKNFPLKIRNPIDLKTLQREIKYKFKVEELLARAAFIWIANNIEYDCEGLNKGEAFYTHHLNDVLIKKKAVCAGYANLYKNFCDEFNLNCHKVNGYAYTYADSLLERNRISPNHAWNIVGVNGSWKIVDATWGSGSSNSGCTKFNKQINEKYFFAKPEEIIKTHYPFDSSWQLLPKPYSFSELIKIGLQDKITDSLNEAKKYADSVITKKLGDTIRFMIFTKVDILNIISISTNEEPQINIFEPIIKFERGYYYDFVIKHVGNYHLTVSYFNFKDNDATIEGTQVENYLLKIEKSYQKIKKILKATKTKSRRKLP